MLHMQIVTNNVNYMLDVDDCEQMELLLDFLIRLAELRERRLNENEAIRNHEKNTLA